jgi:hypothetical protein
MCVVGERNYQEALQPVAESEPYRRWFRAPEEGAPRGGTVCRDCFLVIRQTYSTVTP